MTQAPIHNFYSIQSARYKLATRQHKGVALTVYHHPSHGWNVPKMLDSMAVSLDYYQSNFGPYQFGYARIIEFPGYSGFAQAFAGTMPYSESIGFAANTSDPDVIDYVTYVTAHELGHQYWAHQVVGANMQGSTVTSETLAQYSALMVMKKIYGPEKIRRFLKYELDDYLSGRQGEAIEELPLYRAMRGESTDRVLMYLRNEAISGGRFVRISGRPWVLARGERRGGVVVFSDITAEVLAEEHSRVQIQVLDAVPLAILALDAAGNVVYWNHSAERLMGWSAAELVGRRGRDVLLDEVDREQIDGIRAYMLAGKHFRGEFRVRRPDGSHVRVLAAGSARHLSDGTLDGFVVVGYDLTESHRAQDAMGERQAEIQQFQ